MHVFVVLPAYNEAAVIGNVVRDVKPFGEALVVDDGSTDNTALIAETAGAIVVKLDANQGYDGALDAGFRAAIQRGADIVVSFDSDGQFGSDALEAIIAPFNKGSPLLVIGVRPAKARWSELLFGLYSSFRFGVPDLLCGVKAYKQEIFLRHGYLTSRRSVGTEIAHKAMLNNEKIAIVPVSPRPRVGGRSRFGVGWAAEKKILIALIEAVKRDFQLWKLLTWPK